MPALKEPTRQPTVDEAADLLEASRAQEAALVQQNYRAVWTAYVDRHMHNNGRDLSIIAADLDIQPEQIRQDAGLIGRAVELQARLNERESATQARRDAEAELDRFETEMREKHQNLLRAASKARANESATVTARMTLLELAATRKELFDWSTNPPRLLGT
ncbi:MAG TPA: hypothetical protein VG713_12420 [Pirellulales bacterium]|nr:hypothetical protein [Pirellulales bacterium]